MKVRLECRFISGKEVFFIEPKKHFKESYAAIVTGFSGGFQTNFYAAGALIGHSSGGSGNVRPEKIYSDYIISTSSSWVKPGESDLTLEIKE